MFYGNGDIRVRELTADGTELMPGGIDALVLEMPRDGIGLRCEGCHAYKINGYYYLIFIEWPRTGNARRRVVGYRSQHLLGPYERKILSMTIWGSTIKALPKGDSSIRQMEIGMRSCLGSRSCRRIPHVVPVKWEDDWPLIGINGKVPVSIEIDLPESKFDRLSSAMILTMMKIG